MADVFQNSVSRFASAFSADRAQLTFSNGDIRAGALVQNANFGYAQSVTRLYEVGANVVYYVSGRTQGQAGLGRVVGPGTLLAEFYRTYGDVCQASRNHLAFNVVNRCVDTGSPTYLCKYVVLVNIGIGVAAADMVVNESSSAMFSAMEYNE